MRLLKFIFCTIIIFFLFLFSPLSLSEILKFQAVKTNFVLPLNSSTIQRASLAQDNKGNYQGLHITLNSASAKKLHDFSTINIGSPLAIMFNEKTLSTSIIQSPLSSPLLVAGLTKEEAQAFLDSLKRH